MVPYFCVVEKASSFWPLNLLYNSNLLGKGIQVYLKKITNSTAFYVKHIKTVISHLLKLRAAGKILDKCFKSIEYLGIFLETFTKKV